MVLCANYFIVMLFTSAKFAIGLDTGVLSLLENFPGKDQLNRSQNLNDTQRAIDELNSFLDMKFLITQNPHQKDPGFKRFRQSMDKFLALQQRITNGLNNALWSQEVISRGNNDEIGRVRLFVRAIHDGYREDSPLDGISSVINESFFKQLEEFGDVCVSNMSALQLITRLYQNIQWLSAQFRIATKIIYDISEKYELLSQDDLKESRERFSASKISESYVNLSLVYSNKTTKISQSVYACEPSLNTPNNTTSELRVFRRLFLEYCSKERPRLGNYDPRLSCSSIKTLPPICNDSLKSDICSIWQTCTGEILCRDLQEPMTVCLGEEYNQYMNRTVNVYEQYATSEKLDRSKCKTPYSLEKKKLSRTLVADSSPLFLAPTVVGRVCSSCPCVCQDEPYYFSTEITETEWQNGM
ncbi:hypothetical protein QAD02_005715 [Eretmocerus hayati]|uniref:Uncharacterized protein n=1 Tax=Eretmocerus hayati TaxID=131215 RepID=A0ACC2NTB0_9HYME|nr:hypothetical protein QAD02_005715 [Eretmocerus hayati]